jgi:thiol-disulfide isomerase/thioredoxin
MFGAISLALGCKQSMPVPEGDIAAALTVPSADDARPFDPASLRGKPTLVLFASPTCPYCAEELPLAVAAASATDANIVTVFIAGAKKNAASVTKSLNYDGPTLVDDGTLSKRFAIKSVPYTLILDANGVATAAFRGLQPESTLRDALADAR